VIRLTKTVRGSRKRVRTAYVELGRLHEVHTVLAVEGTLNISGAFEDLTELFEVLVHVLLFNGVMSFVLG
jgi:hypothetical protein